MEEERIQFSKMIKDAKRRLREFLIHMDKDNPSVLDKVSRGSWKNNVAQTTSETNQICYKRLSYGFEKSEEDLRLAKTRKARSFTKRNRPNAIKKRFRHSIIGNGNEFSDLDEALLVDACVYEEQSEDSRSNEKKTVDQAFTQYLNELHSHDVVGTQKGKAWDKKVNTEPKVGQLVDIDVDSGLDHNCNLKRRSNKRTQHRRTYTGGLKDIREKCDDYIIRNEISTDFFDRRPHLLDAGLTSDNTESLASVAFSREQKRRLKNKMKQALRKPENYFYMGNL